MQPVAERQRHCAACAKVVHNITGMSREEIFALLQSDPGNVCVNFVDIKVVEGTEIKAMRLKVKPKPATQLRYVAATAALLLLVQQSHTAPLRLQPMEWQPETPAHPQTNPANTIVSGMVVDQDGKQIWRDLEVLISCDGVEMARLKAQNGLFSCDLQGHSDPGDIITIAILPGPQASSLVTDAPVSGEPTTLAESGINLDVFTHQSISCAPQTYQAEQWSGGSMQIRLADAQNIQIPIKFHAFQIGMEVISTGGVPMDYRDYGLIVLPYITLDAPQSSTKRAQDESCTDH
jgi:hypothetical protein